MLSKRKKTNKAGFTIIELMATVFILLIGITGTMILISQIFLGTRVASSKLMAVYLAQEGVEIVRNIRDANWIERVSWDDGLGEGEFEADYDDFSLSPWQDEGRYLNIDSGIYNYDSGSQSRFKRRITLEKNVEGNNEIQISSEVIWREGEKDFEVIVSERLYDWE